MNRWTVRTLFSGGLVERKSNAAMRDDTIPGEFSAPEPPAPIEEKGEMTPARFAGGIRRCVEGGGASAKGGAAASLGRYEKFEAGFFEVVHTQKAMRRLLPDPIPEEDLWTGLDAAPQAPSGGHRHA